MKNIKLNTGAGDNFTNVAKEAKRLATSEKKLVEFDFNGILCVVSNETNLNYLYRDYCNAHIMSWNTIGHDCVNEYSEETEQELNRRRTAYEEAAELESKKYREEEAKKQLSFFEKIKNEEFSCSNPKLMKDYEDKNQDGYGGRCVSYAKEWARAMQAEMKQGKKLVHVAEYTSHEANYDGITGFMYGAAVSMLANCWEHGEQLRKWHNKEYNHEGDGVVNPAILKIG